MDYQLLKELQEQEALDLIIQECDRVLNTLKPFELELVNAKVKRTLQNIKP